jgi:hypothetical protein
MSLNKNTDCIIVLREGLGNQLFMFFAAFNYSYEHNKNLKIIWDKNETKRPKYFDSILSKFGKYVIDSCNKPFDLYKEQKFSYTPIPYTENNIVLYGYFQSSKYFSKINLDAIKDMLNFGDCCQNILMDSIKSRGLTPVILHVRRSDYLSLPNYHPVQTLDYYKAGIEIIRKNVNNPYFLLISDDIKFLENIQLEQDEKTIVDETDIKTMHLMSLCRYFIIANSSYSWWGAMLGGYDLVVAPKIWFGRDGPQDWQDIYESGWIVI